MNPLVSILIPAYNSERWIADSLESAIAQTWQNKEILVVDDGSADETLRVARQYESKAVKVVTQRNRGAAAARNKAFSLSQGDYIQWLDADDLLAPEKIESQVAALSRCANPRTLASGPWAHFLYRQRRAEFSATALWNDLTPLEWLLRKMEQNLHMQTATWLVSREVTEAAGPWNTQLLVDDDGEYFCRVLLQSCGVKFVPDAKVFYRASGAGSLSYIGGSSGKIEAQFHSMQLHIDYVRSLEDSARVRAACVAYLQTWLVYFYPERLDIVKRAEDLAVELGGRLEIPRFSWKYAWLDKVAGPNLAKRGQVAARKAKWSAMRSLDRILLGAEKLRTLPTWKGASH
jgi:glycosyltransferase involved in cell wall biosynthesis